MCNLYSSTKYTPKIKMSCNSVEIWINKQQDSKVILSNNEGFARMSKYYLIFVSFANSSWFNFEFSYFWSLLRERIQFIHILNGQMCTNRYRYCNLIVLCSLSQFYEFGFLWKFWTRNFDFCLFPIIWLSRLEIKYYYDYWLTVFPERRLATVKRAN